MSRAISANTPIAKPGYELTLAARSSEAVEPHPLETRGHAVVSSGVLDITLETERYCLGPDDALMFNADIPHSYENRGELACRVYLVLTADPQAEAERTRARSVPQLQTR